MTVVGIVANGPAELLPDLPPFQESIDIWIGADKGALTLIKHRLIVDYALGDFDSIDTDEKHKIKNKAKVFKEYPKEKDETDLELALMKAFELNATKIYLFGVTGGRIDHTLINIQTLKIIEERKIKGVLIDRYNKIELTLPGEHTVFKDENYPYISFIPMTPLVNGLTLSGFYYPLTDEIISMGSTLCISNKLLSNKGTFLYKEGILLVVKSRDSTI